MYALLSDVDKYPSWRPTVKSLTRQPDRDGRPAWTEEVSGMTIPLYFEKMERPSLLVARIADPSLPFGGTWTYRIALVGPRFRGDDHRRRRGLQSDLPVMSRFVFGHEATLKEFVSHLEARACK